MKEKLPLRDPPAQTTDSSPGVLLTLAIVIILEIFLIMNYHPLYEHYFDATMILLFCFGAYWAYYLLLAMRKTPERVCSPLTNLKQYDSFVQSQRERQLKKLYESEQYKTYEKEKQLKSRQGKVGASNAEEDEEEDEFIKELRAKEDEIFADD